MDIVCLGELLLDMFPAEMGRGIAEQTAWHPKPGGAPANVAVAAARLGSSPQLLLSSAFIGKVGDEAFGHYLVEVLRQNQVDVSGVRFETGAKTTLAFHAKPDANTAEFLFYRDPGADMLLRPDELDCNLLRCTRVLHTGSITLAQDPSRSATQEAVKIAREAGALISFDVNYRPTLWKGAEEARARMMEMIPNAHLLKVNEVEIGLLTGSGQVESAAKALLALGPKLVVVTLGPRGSYFCTAQGGMFVAAFVVETVDAVGCGDAFIAALLTRLVAGGEDWHTQLTPGRLAESVRFANAAGALTALKPGVIPALPTRHEVEQFLQEKL